MDLRTKLEAAREKLGVEITPEPEPAPVFDPDLIPEDPYTGSHESAKDHITFLEGYQKYVSPRKDGFMPSYRTSQRESIKVRCPNPDHVDKNPSAWVNTDKQVCYCAVCDQGWDLYDLAALEYGYPVPIYRSNKDQFKEIADRVAEDFGLSFTRTAAGPAILRTVEPDPEPRADLEPDALPLVPVAPEPGTESDPPGKSEPHLKVVSEPEEFDWGTVRIEYPEIDYAAVRTPGTFIDSWLSLGETLNYTKAHFLFTALPAISLAVRRHIVAADEPRVRNNLYVVLLGESGSTKTKAQSLFIRLIKQSFGDDSDPDLFVRLFTPISGEDMVANMAVDSAASTIDNAGCITTNEYARLAEIMKRSGSTMETYFQDYYDNEEPVTNRKWGKAFNHHLCMVTTTQPDRVKDHLTKDFVQSGYANRLIFSYGPPGEPDDWNTTVDLTTYRDQLWDIYAHYRHKYLEVVLEPDAQSYWSEFFHDVIVPDKRTSTPLMARSDLHIKKFFTLFQANELADRVLLHHVEQSCALYSYLKKSAEFVQGKVGFGEHEDCHDDILSYLQKKPQTPARRLEPTMRKRGHKYKVTMATLNMMKDIGEVKVEKMGDSLVYSLTDHMRKVRVLSKPK